MTLHKGEILKAAIEESGITITSLITKINKYYKHIKCSRTKMYHLFKQKEIDNQLLIVIGRIIYHDFSEDIPGIEKQETAAPTSEITNPRYSIAIQKHVLSIREKHAQLQKKYIDLLGVLTKVANQNNDTELKGVIKIFLDKIED